MKLEKKPSKNFEFEDFEDLTREKVEEVDIEVDEPNDEYEYQDRLVV